MSKLIRQSISLMVVLVLPASLWALPAIQRQTTQQQRQAQSRTALQSQQPSGAYYNQIQQPQFVVKVLTGTGEKAKNGCIGDGGANSFFADDFDEAYAHLKSLDPNSGPRGDLESCWPNFSAATDMGTYQFLQIEDRCRTVGGCGTLTTDGRSCVMGLPQYATNVVSWGQKKICDETVCENPASVNPNDPRWQGRNYTPNLLYGRYLLKCQNWGNISAAPAASIDSGMGLHMDTSRASYPYQNDVLSPYFFDCPYTSRDIVDGGFTCSQIAVVDGYKAKPDIAGRNGSLGGSSFETMEEERRVFYRSLLELAVNSLGGAIARGVFGDVYAPSPSVGQREEKEIVVNAFAILNGMVSRLDGENCQTSVCRIVRAARRFAGSLISMERGPVPNGAILHYDHENHRIVLRSDIGRDCMSKKTSGAHPYFNVQSCEPSYGLRIGGGTFDETAFQNPGYELYVGRGVRNPDQDALLGRPRDANLPADGYACQIAGEIAHQLVHAYFRGNLNRNRMAAWPSPESLWEEEQAVATEALVVDQLAELGYCPKGQEFKKENFIRAITTDRNLATLVVTSTTPGTRFYYTQPARGFNGISLSPYYTNMFNIARHLKEQRPEDARMTALEAAMCPIFDPPSHMCANGACGDFVMPQAPQIAPQDQRQQIQQQGTRTNTEGLQRR